MKAEIVDTTKGDYCVLPGEKIKQNIKHKTNALQIALDKLLSRMALEMPDTKTAIALMVTLHGTRALNEQALFFKACIERAAELETQLAELNVFATTLVDNVNYRISDEFIRKTSS